MTLSFPIVSVILAAFYTSHCANAIGYCPPGFFAGQGQTCYRFFAGTGGQQFYSAESVCASHGGHLPSIRNGFENAFVKEIVHESAPGAASALWLGGTHLSSGDAWKWLDGQPFSYANWATNQPSTLGCLYMNVADGRWYSEDCTAVHSFICGVNQTHFECPRGRYPCDSGWTHFDLTDACYKIIHKSLPYEQAEAECGKESSHLVSIHSEGENQMLTDWATTGSTSNTWYNDTWIGFNSLKHSSVYEWTDGSPVDYVNWRPSQPDNGPVSCAMLSTDQVSSLSDAMSTWEDDPCTWDKRAALCKKPAYH